jgi:hypothetical protein
VPPFLGDQAAVLDTGAVELGEEGAQHISRFRTHAVAYRW